MNYSTAQKTWFVLGREFQLSTAEIVAALGLKDYEIFDQCILKTTYAVDAEAMMQSLGGTVKIAQELANSINQNDLFTLIIKELSEITGKIHFGFSLYRPKEQGAKIVDDYQNLKMWGNHIKKTLKNQGFSVRYVENREPILSSVTVEKNGLTKRGAEFIILVENKGGAITYSVAKTIAVQPFEAWGKRDFGRPDRDDVSGMLPPKLAAMLLNISEAKKDEPLLDPFCGSGTILTEACIRGYKTIIGSDASEKAVLDSRKNIEWTLREPGMDTKQPSATVHVSSVQKLPMVVKPSSVATIVTEPYMGKPLRGNESRTDLEKQAAELKKIYLEAFSVFYKLLQKNGVVTFIIPCFKYKSEWVKINCVSEIKKLGFSVKPLLENREFLLYARPNQRVGREVWRFVKH
jgi:hypothetical protein